MYLLRLIVSLIMPPFILITDRGPTITELTFRSSDISCGTIKLENYFKLEEFDRRNAMFLTNILLKKAKAK